MKRLLLIVLLFTCAWNWQTHPSFMISFFYSLPSDVAAQLDLAAMMNGSLAPDRDFHDNRLHHFPPSYNKSLQYIEVVKQKMREGNYTNASYSLGVVSHYVSDSFASPHNIKGESSSEHSAYEKQGDWYYEFVNCSDGKVNFHKNLSKATSTGEHWKTWLETRDPSLPQDAVTQAMDLVFLISHEVLGTGCVYRTTKFKRDHISFITWKQILIAGFCLAFIFLKLFSMYGKGE